MNGHKREERIVEGKALVFQWVLPPGDPPPFCAKAGLFKQLRGAQGSASAPRKRNGKRKRTKNYDSASEEDGPSDVESEFADDDDADDGGRKLVRTSTLEDTFDVDFIVEGPPDHTQPNPAPHCALWTQGPGGELGGQYYPISPPAFALRSTTVSLVIVAP